MDDSQPVISLDDRRVTAYFLGYLKQSLELSGSISRRDWDQAVDAAARYKRSLTGEKPPKREQITPE